MSASVAGSIAPASDLTSAGEVIAAAPLVQLLREMKAKREQYRVEAPFSDAGPTLERAVSSLEAALKAASGAAVRLTVRDAARLYGMPESSVRWLCVNRQDAVKAVKHKGSWTVGRLEFDQFRRSAA